jgi:hypothetical protein
MANNFQRALLLAAAGLVAATLPAVAQERIDPANSIKFDINDDAPVQLVSSDSTESRVTSRGGALVIDLHVLAKLKNRGGDTIRSVRLLLVAGEATPGGKMASSAATANVAPGETFDMRIDGRLLRPVRVDAGPLVRVKLDGVLFKNYDFYGPDLLKSHRQMLAWAMQADRDRQYFKRVLQTRGKAGLQQEMLDSISRQSDRPQLDVQLSRGGRVTTSAASAPDKIAEFAFLQIPDSPIRPVQGWAEIARNEVRAPRIEIQNTHDKSILYAEVGWLVKDLQGKEYFAGSVPASEGELYLPPGRTARLVQDTALRFSHNGKPVDIQDMRGFVSEVEYSDHNIWVPKRETLQQSGLSRVIPPSPEEQHLTSLYLKGVDVLIRELNKF